MRPSVVYISYDGAAEPLGQSQVVAYLEQLAQETDIALISFEKPGDGRLAVSNRLAAAGIEWHPLRYHADPPLVSTLFDALCGAVVLHRVVRRRGANLVHARSYVPALMARLAPAARAVSFLFDIRGFWADERVEGGIWPRGWLYRLAKFSERRFFAAADGVVTLTHASVPQIERWIGSKPVPISVIPTCANVGAFARSSSRANAPRLVWNGSVGTWYRFDLVPRLARASGLQLSILTRQTDEVLAHLDGIDAEVATVAPTEIPGRLDQGDIGLCLVKSTFSKTASTPTRLAEYLASGMPVMVTPGVGDLEEIVESNGVGVVLRDESDQGLCEAARALRELAGDSEVHSRCRQVARDRFDLAVGVAGYGELYRLLTSPRA